MDFDDLEKAGNGVGNIIWVIFGGFLMALGYWFTGLLYCCTIIGIPLGIQLFKLGRFVLWPFGYTLEDKEGGFGTGCLSLLLNVVWFFFGGLELCLTHLLMGLIFCITIIGIPFGMQHFKLAFAALAPFGKEVVEA